MQDNFLYEYAVIRVVPRVEREEFLNVGIILFCKRAKFIQVVFEVNETKLKVLASELDCEQLLCNLKAMQQIASGLKGAGPIAEMDVPSRFRWLTAVRSSSIQTSRPHPGLTLNLEDTIQRLFTELVL
ncbi:DUF3037 domain-containing protein [Flavobacterium agrisoli]|uniref:DUF3037 domain-containing protein n=1 Tax=Flavobacterium agrisoli TaxID=2793066 RepID=A0A934UJQ2_9FLAO|nr:DUF3037 domain-containing protein [Flavobacterium agrisoli]MBK0370127.1 DUF3037 domain-containing protein [Flavobacterium agrisoli]